MIRIIFISGILLFGYGMKLFAHDWSEIRPMDWDTVDCDFLDKYIFDIFEKGHLKDARLLTLTREVASHPKTNHCDSYPYWLTLQGLGEYGQNNIFGARELLLEAENVINNQDLPLNLFHFRNQLFLGLTYNIQDEFQNALLYFNRAREISQQLGDSLALSDSYSNLGLTHFDIGNVKTSKSYYLKALALCTKNNTDENLGYIYQNLARVHINLAVYDSAIYFADRASAIWNNRKDTVGLYYTTQIKAQIFAYQNQHKKTIQLLKQAIQYGQISQTHHLIGEVYYNLAEAYLGQGNIDQATTYYEQALSHGEGLSTPMLRELLNTLTFLYQQNQDNAKIVTLPDKLLDLSENQEQILQLENEKWLQSERALQAERLVTQRLRLSQDFDREKLAIKNRYIAFLLIATFFSSLLAFVLFYIYRQNKELLKKINLQNNQLEEINHELASSTQIISEQNGKLEIKNRELQQFAYTVSHDLRSPITTILSFSELLQQKLPTPLKAENQQILGFIQKSSRHMLQLVTDLLAFAKLGDSQSTFESIDPGVLIQEVIADMSGTVEEKNARIEVTSMPSQIHADPIKLKMVFQNLIHNAIKFVDKDTLPHVHIHYRSSPQFHTFQVADNGIGIPQKFQEAIFNMFQRLHPSHIYEGSGIGLATCLKIIKLHRGTIEVESEEGAGSIFTFHIRKGLPVSPTKRALTVESN